MRVRHGWSGEVESNRWAKFDIELEEDDLRRILVGNGIAPSTVDKLSLVNAYRLLEIEAERLVLFKLIRRYGYSRDSASQQLAGLATELQEILSVYTRTPA